ncbi:hypothetical protein KR009_008083 [Drosophila setifemur]|nr:hypothetical protein KR009_008083 [Drosophila setifemur]
MEQPIKVELKTEFEEQTLDENENTPLRQNPGNSPSHALAPVAAISGCGWDSDQEIHEPGCAPSTPEANLLDSVVKVEPTAKIKHDRDVDDMLEKLMADDFDFETNEQVDRKPRLQPCEPPHCCLDGIPSNFTAKESLNDMDLCSLETLPPGDQEIRSESTVDLFSIKTELLKQLAEVNGKQKKKKKKHKKERTHRSKNDQEEEADYRKRNRSYSSPDESQKKNKRERRHRVEIEKSENEIDFIPVRSDERRVRLLQSDRLLVPAPIPTDVKNLSKQDKRNLALARAEMALKLFKKKEPMEADQEALMVDTVCKLPVSDSFRNQGSFENPSPMCNNMNVVYEFNSTPGTRIDLAKWGLETVPETTRKLLRILGINVERLKEIQRTSKPSQRILKLKQEQMEKGVSPADEMDTATLFKNAATQTDRQDSTRDAGTQARLDPQPRGVFWQDPSFDPTFLSQQQSNVMLALQELSKKLPSSIWAERIYKALEPALGIERSAARQNWC